LLFGCADSNTAGDSPVDPPVDLPEVYSDQGFTSDQDSYAEGIVSVPGAIWMEEDTTSEGGYNSSLFIFGEDSSFQHYIYQGSPETSSVQSGEWSVDESGNLILDIPDQETIMVQLLGDNIDTGNLDVLIDDGTRTPYSATWYWSPPGYPVDDSLIPGTYLDQYGDTWVFESDGTGSAPGEAGGFTWEVDDRRLLKVFFEDGLTGLMYINFMSEKMGFISFYTVIDCAFVEYGASGDFDSYHGEMQLIRQGSIIPDTVPADELLEHGAIWFKDNTTSAGVYNSSLFFFGDDFSFQQYNYQSLRETSTAQSGKWSFDESGDIIINISGQETIAVTLVGDYGFGVFFYREVLIDDGTQPPYSERWWSCDPELYPYDDSWIPGTYNDQYGDTWVFGADGTGSASREEGAFTWEVVDGLLVVSYPDGHEYWMYKIQARHPHIWTETQFYQKMNCAFVEYGANGEFDSYHGEMQLMRQE